MPEAQRVPPALGIASPTAGSTEGLQWLSPASTPPLAYGSEEVGQERPGQQPLSTWAPVNPEFVAGMAGQMPMKVGAEVPWRPPMQWLMTRPPPQHGARMYVLKTFQLP